MDMSSTPLLFINSQSVQAFFLRIFPVNSPDLLNEKWIIMDGISSNILFQGFSKCLSSLRQICVACIACVSRNKFKHVRIFASPLRPSLRPLRPLRHLSPTIHFSLRQKRLGKDAMEADKERIVGARL